MEPLEPDSKPRLNSLCETKRGMVNIGGGSPYGGRVEIRSDRGGSIVLVALDNWQAKSCLAMVYSVDQKAVPSIQKPMYTSAKSANYGCWNMSEVSEARRCSRISGECCDQLWPGQVFVLCSSVDIVHVDSPSQHSVARVRLHCGYRPRGSQFWARPRWSWPPACCRRPGFEFEPVHLTRVRAHGGARRRWLRATQRSSWGWPASGG